MINPSEYLGFLLENGISFFTGVPDSLMQNFCSCLMSDLPQSSHVIAANEGAAVALAIGDYIGSGNVPLVYMQNSGIGNAINPLLSLASPDVYAVPMILMIGWRGEPGFNDEPQHKHQGRVTKKMFEAMDIPVYELSADKVIAYEETTQAIDMSFASNGPVAILVSKGTFETFTNNNSFGLKAGLTREAAIIATAEALDPKTIVISTTGMASRELFEHRVSSGNSGEVDFLTVGGMGHANQIALGLAMSRPNQSICCIDGDGAVLMHMGSLAILGQSRKTNILHMVLNNGVHDSVGGQPTVARSIDLCTIAYACGYTGAKKVTSLDELTILVQEAQKLEGPYFIEVIVNPGNRSDLGRPTNSPVDNKIFLQRFLAES